MADEKVVPCHYCGTEIRVHSDETRLYADCPKCGKSIGITHGSFNLNYMDPMGENEEITAGHHAGFMTIEEWNKLFRTNAIKAIRWWEEVIANPLSNPDECRETKNAAIEALKCMGTSRSITLDGKRYHAVSAGREIRVTTVRRPKARE
jgi:hypothetical protein